MFSLACAHATEARPGTPGSAQGEARQQSRPGTTRVLAGVDVLLSQPLPPILAGRRVGLITNHTGRTRDGGSTIDALHAHEGLDLVALYSPEHGIRGTALAGEVVTSGRDERTGLPIHSLYGATRKPTPDMLRDVDVLIFDIQDIGSRYYTYIWTMALALEAAGENGLGFVVLDRPNPIGGALIQGNVLDPAFSTFVGLHPVPMRHGLTVGEMARYLNTELGYDARLHVVPVAGLQRTQWLDDTGLDWRPPSPSMPSLESAAHYPGTCLFEGTNLSVGRGTDAAFQQIGAPWLDADAVIARLRAHALPGVSFEAVEFTPRAPADGKHPDARLQGIRYTVTDRGVYDPTRTAVATLTAIQALHADSLTFLVSHFDRLAGTAALRTGILNGRSMQQLTSDWDEQSATFAARSAPYLLYPSDATAPPVPGIGSNALERSLRARIAEAPAEISVAFIDLGTGRSISIDGDVVMHAASTMKVPVLIEALRRHDEGALQLDDGIMVDNRFHSIADSSVYSLTAGEDSDSALYARIGQEVTIRELLERMITRSSNLATNQMLKVFPAADVRATLARINAQDMHVLRGVEDIPAYERGMNNTTTANAFARVLESIARCRILSRASCDTALEILAGQQFDDMIPAGLPAGTRVANKTGWITRIQHDGGIVYPPGRAPYVLVILTRGFEDTDEGARTAADLSRIVWQHVTDPAWGLPEQTSDAGIDSLLTLHDRVLLPEVGYRRVTHEHYWNTLAPFIGGTVQAEEIGRSAEGRQLQLLRYGTGPRTLLLWSQMHGDESTATMALADMVHYMADSDARARLWADSLTILMIPMLNPDGAARFRRHNAYGIDVNRDARMLATPEARALKAAHTRFQPDFGFNLHDQNPRTRVGDLAWNAAISLLAPAADEPDTDPAVAARAKHLAATLRDAAEPIVGGHVTRYDDSYNPRAFGDLVQQWGTTTVLIESGGWRDDPEKQLLRRANFVMLARAFDAIATGTYTNTPIERYVSLPENGRSMRDLVIHGGTVVIAGLEPYRADLAVDVSDTPAARDDARIMEIGDLQAVSARSRFDATGAFIHLLPAALDTEFGGVALRPGAIAAFVVRAGAAADSEMIAEFEGGRLVIQ